MQSQDLQQINEIIKKTKINKFFFENKESLEDLNKADDNYIKSLEKIKAKLEKK